MAIVSGMLTQCGGISDACEQHIQCLQPVLQAIRTAWLSLKSKKCHFGYGELNFLGHTVSNAGICPDTKRTTAVATFQTPTNKAFVRQFLKLCAWPPRLHALAAFALPVPFGTLASKKKKKCNVARAPVCLEVAPLAEDSNACGDGRRRQTVRDLNVRIASLFTRCRFSQDNIPGNFSALPHALPRTFCHLNCLILSIS